MQTKKILISGGTGFIGQAVAKMLLKNGQTVRILTRQILVSQTFFTGDITKPETLAGVCDGIDIVIQCAQFPGHPFENKRKHYTYFEVDALGTENLAKAAKATGVKHFIYISGAGTDGKKLEPWFKAKWYAEQAIHGTGIPATILRPSMVYGPGDKSLNCLLKMAKFFPILPLIVGGKNHVQPIFVEDLAEIVAVAVETAGDQNRVLDVGGPEEMTMKELLQQALKITGRRRLFFPVPKFPLKMLGLKAVDFITMDVHINIEPLKKTFPQIKLKSLEEGLKSYLIH